MKKILITGATGFVGQALSTYLIDKGYVVTAGVRSKNDDLPDTVTQVLVGDLQPNTNWSDALFGVDLVIHLAARVHVMKDDCNDPMAFYRLINTDSTLNLAKQATDAGVTRFIFLSSIKVNGEYTTKGIPFTADDMITTQDPYGLSKYEAEQGLKRLSILGGMEFVIIRSPLVYGPGVKGNFLQMIKMVSKGIPLPFGAINNRRSLVALDNLTNLIFVCLEHGCAHNQIFLVSDGQDISTTDLLYRMGKALGRPVLLFGFSRSFLNVVLSLLGKQSITQRLYTSLEVDISKTKSILGWAPIINLDTALVKTAEAWLKQHQ